MTMREILVDLSHPMENGMPVWPGHPEFLQKKVASFENGDIACNHSLGLSEHSGTHLDAPAHFVPGGASIDAIPLERFQVPLAVLHPTDIAPDSELPAQAILDWEDTHGQLPEGAAVMVHYGWDRFWADPEEGHRFLSDWPGLSAKAADLLVMRAVGIVGCDCMSIDRYSSTDFPAHRKLLGAGILIGENFARLGDLPPLCRLTAFPLPLVGGSGSPLRAVAHVPAP